MEIWQKKIFLFQKLWLCQILTTTSLCHLRPCAASTVIKQFNSWYSCGKQRLVMLKMSQNLQVFSSLLVVSLTAVSSRKTVNAAVEQKGLMWLPFS